MKAAAALVPLLLLLVGCGGGEQGPGQNDAARISEQIEKQSARIAGEAENGTAAIEQALENEGAVIFENRGNLLNEAAGDGAAAGNSAAPAPAPRR